MVFLEVVFRWPRDRDLSQGRFRESQRILSVNRGFQGSFREFQVGPRQDSQGSGVIQRMPSFIFFLTHSPSKHEKKKDGRGGTRPLSSFPD